MYVYSPGSGEEGGSGSGRGGSCTPRQAWGSGRGAGGVAGRGAHPDSGGRGPRLEKRRGLNISHSKNKKELFLQKNIIN